MFIGHYSACFFAKSLDKRIPLWLLFICAQFVDILWGSFILLGIEKVRIVPGITLSNPLDLYYMPYTHSLVAAIGWAVAVSILCRIAFGTTQTKRSLLLIATVVFSHWILDFITHRPDLALYDDSHKVGLGLWNYPLYSFIAEAGLFLGSIFVYSRSSDIKSGRKFKSVMLFGLILTAIQAVNQLGPLPDNEIALVLLALFSYFIFSIAAGWLERRYIIEV